MLQARRCQARYSIPVEASIACRRTSSQRNVQLPFPSEVHRSNERKQLPAVDDVLVDRLARTASPHLSTLLKTMLHTSYSTTSHHRNEASTFVSSKLRCCSRGFCLPSQPGSGTRHTVRNRAEDEYVDAFPCRYDLSPLLLRVRSNAVDCPCQRKTEYHADRIARTRSKCRRSERQSRTLLQN